jgi:hypothetical protein
VSDDPDAAAADAAPADGETAASGRERWHQAVVTRVYYGSDSGTLTSVATGREYVFKGPFVQIVGPIPRVDGLREGMTVGFDLAWTSRGRRVNVIRVFD